MKIQNQTIKGHTPDVLSALPYAFYNCIITSPPYFGQRNYHSEPQVWDGSKGCRHSWGSEIIYRERGTVAGPTAQVRNTQKGLSDTKKGRGWFCQKCGAWYGELGLEPNVDLYIKHLCDIFDAAKRVLRDDGTLWVVLADAYAGSGKGIGSTDPKWKARRDENKHKTDWREVGVPAKSLCCAPDKFRIEMLRRGWILRNRIAWHKPNAMPSPITTRFTVDFEDVMLFTKSNKPLYWIHARDFQSVSSKPVPDYRWIRFTGKEQTTEPDENDWQKRRVPCPDCNGTGFISLVEDTPLYGEIVIAENVQCSRCYKPDKPKDFTVPKWQRINLWEGRDYWFQAQYEPYVNPLDRWGGQRKKVTDKLKGEDNPYEPAHRDRVMRPNPLGKNKRTTWTIPTEAFSEAHFATFPQALVEPMVRAGCPEFVCRQCGMGREKINITRTIKRRRKTPTTKPCDERGPSPNDYGGKEIIKAGYSDCGCPAPSYRPGYVLDLFMGSGTTGLVAYKLGRSFTGIDLVFANMAGRRVAEEKKKNVLFESA